MTSDNGIHYVISGSGDPAIIFLHYFGSSGETWACLTDHLSANYRCVAPDLRGFGYSGSSIEKLGVEDYADDIQCLIESLALKKYVLVGHSMGGKIAMALAARKLPGLQSMILLAPSPPTPEPMSHKDREELRHLFGKADKITNHIKKLAAQPLDEVVLRKETSIQLQADEAAWQAWLDTGSRENISATMGKIDVPVLIIGGGADTGITPKILADEVQLYLGKSQLRLLAETGHLLHLERSQEVTASIQDWIAQ